MTAPRRSVLILMAACAFALLTACSPNPPTPGASGASGATPAPPSKTSCDCSVFPPKQGCDSQCGITTGIIEKMTADSVTISVPSINATANGHKSAQISQRTFSIGPAEATQLQTVRQGSRVALTFHTESGLSALKSIREIPPPAK